ncbi:hypothetical protein FA95DRAFT_1556843 [Auriscalpium vulgare]|uniref:Uncharacterized protein n=1 Tax=Auriscalpium vulgare TaxID=40419 RepID=A0ACB8S0L1_9AGAM|nr:hypothetical protein FA95DRAFT_1556843 [Auriscalpium vulgare]
MAWTFTAPSSGSLHGELNKYKGILVTCKSRCAFCRPHLVIRFMQTCRVVDDPGPEQILGTRPRARTRRSRSPVDLAASWPALASASSSLPSRSTAEQARGSDPSALCVGRRLYRRSTCPLKSSTTSSVLTLVISGALSA